MNIDISVRVGDLASSGVAQAGEDNGAIGGGGKGWLVAIAKAMGNALGVVAAKLVSLSNQLDDLASSASDDQQSAKEFQKTMAEFQAQSQLFSMLSNSFSTAIKSIGEGMTSLGRKQ